MKQNPNGKTSWTGGANWKLNLMLPSSVGAVTKVLVLAGDWSAGGPYVQVYPDLPCLDTTTTRYMKRSRLGAATPSGSIQSCGDGSNHQVVRCDVI